MFPDATTSLLLKVCGAGILCLLLYFWGRGHGVESGRAHNAALIAQKDRALNAAARSLSASADVLDLVNRRAAEAKVEAQAQALAAEKAVAGAGEDAKAYESKIASIADKLARASKAPSCKAQLEEALCVTLE